VNLKLKPKTFNKIRQISSP